MGWMGPSEERWRSSRFASPVDEMNRSRVMSEIDAMLKEVGSKPIDPAGIGLDGSGPSKC